MLQVMSEHVPKNGICPEYVCIHPDILQTSKRLFKHFCQHVHIVSMEVRHLLTWPQSEDSEKKTSLSWQS